jgi:uncharacterized protein
MGKKIIIDTNILISALGWEGKCRELLRQTISGRYIWYISRKQLTELLRVMDYKKFQFTKEQKSRFLNIIYSSGIIIDTNIRISVSEDVDDNMLLEAAVEINADYIISGDIHLRKINCYNGIRIVCVGEFLELCL